jgi:hypothetical protein
MAEDKNKQSLEEVAPAKVDALESVEVEEVEEVAESTESEEVAESTETEETEVSEVEDEEEVLEADEKAVLFDVKEMQSMVDAFGSDIAMATVLNGGDYEDAKEMYNTELIEENKALKSKLAEKHEGAPAVDFDALEEKEIGKPKRVRDLFVKR